MVSSEDGKPGAAKKSIRRKVVVGWIIGLILLVLLGSFIGVRISENVSNTVKVPEHITKEMSPIYLPQKMPGHYEIMEDSFVIEEDNVLIFQASDGAGGTITFTQQPKPKEINFEEFYAQHVTDAETLDNVPYPSVAGKSKTNENGILSVVADGVWLIATSRSPLSTGDLEIIAKTLKQYQD